MNRRIVVGIDGSASSNEALLWAADYARATGGAVHAIHAWLPPTGGLTLPPVFTDWAPLEHQAEELPRRVVEEVLGDRPGVQVIPRTIRGGAAQVLVDASRHAELLVVGSLGLGGLKGMMLGSTGHHCAAHSHCPVVIVHHEHKPVHQPRREVGKAHATA
jgi:nucleotide-binding universal stress UspA family protein